MAKRIGAAFWAALFLAIMGGCNGPVAGVYPPEAGEGRDVYLVNNHWHTGFVFATSELSPEIRRLLPRFSDSQWLEIGWGDNRFYRSRKTKIGLALAALFASRGSVLHVVPLSSPPEVHYQEFITDLYRIRISTEGQRRLMAFVEQSFCRDETGAGVEIEPGWAPGSWFYQASGRYSLFHTCNQWTADGLRTTGFPISPFYASTANNVGWQIRTFGAKYQSDLLVLHDGNAVRAVPMRAGAAK